MALECPRCGFDLDQGKAGAPCPKCGAAMRFTLLGEYMKERKATEAAKKQEKSQPPRFSGHAVKWLLGVVLVHVVAYMLGGLAILCLGTRETTVEDFAKEQPSFAIAAVLGIPIFATFLSVTLTCNQVYLAQLVGFAIGLAANLGILIERVFVGPPPGWQEWVATPVICAIVGFLSGYRITGPKFKEEPESEVEDDDEWRTSAAPAIKEIDPGMTVRRQRLVIGAVVGLLFPFIVPPLLGFFLKAMSRRPDFVNQQMARYEFVFAPIALLIAGIAAGSGTTRGIRQGVYVGLLLFTIMFLISGAGKREEALIRFLPSIAVSAFGGYIGQKVFRPTQIYTGPKFQ